MTRLIVVVLVIVCCSIQAAGQDTLRWREDRKPQWKDFRGLPDTTSAFSAETFSNLTYALTYNRSGFSIDINCYFLANESWTKRTDQGLLDHEQGHFNLAELCARKFRKEVRSYKFRPDSVFADIKKIYVAINAERQRLNYRYDTETKHGNDRKKQTYWDAWIAGALEKLSNYSR